MKKKLIILIFAFLFVVAPVTTLATEGDTRTILGEPYTGDNSGASKAYLDNPKGFAIDSNNNILIADTTNNVIRKIDNETNIINKHAGSGEFGSLDGFRLLNQFGYPEDIVIDGQDKMYVADTYNSKIRKIDGDNVTTIVSEGLSSPKGVLVRGDDLFIADTGHNRIVRTKLDGSSMIEVISGCDVPTKMAWRGQFLYVLHSGNNSIEQIDLFNGTRERIAGGFENLEAIEVLDNDLYALAGRQGVWNEIYRIDLSTKELEMLQKRRETEMLNWASDILFKKTTDDEGRVLSTRMFILFKGGSSVYGFDIDGANEEKIAGNQRYGNEYGAKEEALLGRPQEMVMSPDGFKIYISENNRIVEYNLITNVLKEIAGSPMDNYREHTGSKARFSDVTSMAMASDGNTLYLADRNNHRIRSLNIETKTTSYITGAGEINAFYSDNGYQEGGPCPDTFEKDVEGCAYFNRPTGIALSPDEKTLYVAEGSNNRIRGVDIATGITFHIAGTGEVGYVNGFGSWTKWNGPFTIAASDDGRTLYVVDKYNHAIREINIETKNVVTLVNNRGLPGDYSGYAPDSLLHIPEYIELGEDGDIYITEAGGLRVKAVNISTRQVRLVSGSGLRGLYSGNKENTRWSSPKGMARRGDWLFVADFYSDLIKLINLR